MPALSQTQVGVNLTNGDRLSKSIQLAALSELQEAGAKVIRIPLEPRTWGQYGLSGHLGGISTFSIRPGHLYIVVCAHPGSARGQRRHPGWSRIRK